MGKRKTPEGVTEEEFSKWESSMLDYIDRLPHSEQVKIGHALNHYHWLNDLPGKPEGWEEMDNEEQHLWVTMIYQYIAVTVGDKALLRYFHTTELGKTDREFEDWWDSHHEAQLTMVYKKSCNIENNATQRANNSTDKRDPPIVMFFLGFFSGVLLIEFISLIFKIIGLL